MSYRPVPQFLVHVWFSPSSSQYCLCSKEDQDALVWCFLSLDLHALVKEVIYPFLGQCQEMKGPTQAHKGSQWLCMEILCPSSAVHVQPDALCRATLCWQGDGLDRLYDGTQLEEHRRGVDTSTPSLQPPASPYQPAVPPTLPHQQAETPSAQHQQQLPKLCTLSCVDFIPKLQSAAGCDLSQGRYFDHGLKQEEETTWWTSLMSDLCSISSMG